MPKIDSAPFLTVPIHASPGAVPVLPQHWLLDDERELLPGSVIPGWDYERDLLLSRELRIGCAQIAEQCRLGPGATLRILAQWTTTIGRYLHGESDLYELPVSPDEKVCSISLRVPGSLVGGELTLETQICLGLPTLSPPPLSAVRPGSKLWSDALKLTLEGFAPRMPIALADFGKEIALPAPADSNWFVRLQPGCLALPVSIAVQVFVNVTKSHLAKAITEDADNLDDQQRMIRSFLQFDVGRQLVEFALRDDEFIEHPDAYELGSLGWALQAQLRRIFEVTDPPAVIRQMMERDPSRFHSLLQSGFRLLG